MGRSNRGHLGKLNSTGIAWADMSDQQRLELKMECPFLFRIIGLRIKQKKNRRLTDEYMERKFRIRGKLQGSLTASSEKYAVISRKTDIQMRKLSMKI